MVVIINHGSETFERLSTRNGGYEVPLCSKNGKHFYILHLHGFSDSQEDLFSTPLADAKRVLAGYRVAIDKDRKNKCHFRLRILSDLRVGINLGASRNSKLCTIDLHLFLS